MKIIATIVLGLIVGLASIFCLLCSVCAVSAGAKGGIAAIFALGSLAVAIGGVMLIGKINRAP